MEITTHEQREVAGEAIYEVGQWHWIITKDGDGNACDVLVCITDIGSNYVKVEGPELSSRRILFSNFDVCHIRQEQDPSREISKMVDLYRGKVRESIVELKLLTKKLGVSQQRNISECNSESTGTDIAVIADKSAPEQYKKELIQAKDVTIPELQSRIEDESESLSEWMKAELIQITPEINHLKQSEKWVKDRIFNVDLYAGLSENLTQIVGGNQATMADRIYVMQQMRYMDEESLVNYQHGGMEFNNISEFDEWLLHDENFLRTFPHPKTVVAFRVRRHSKSRHADSLATALINFRLEQLDKITFLYIRNGEQLWRMNTDYEFEDYLFPNDSEFDLSQMSHAETFGNRIDDVVSKSYYDGLRERHEERRRKLARAKAAHRAWKKENPGKDDHDSPHYFESNRWVNDRIRNYIPFDESTPLYDDIMEFVKSRMENANRFALILQGLLDRSTCLHPHPPVRIWRQSEMNDCIELVRESRGLYDGEKPKFDEYAKIGIDALTKGHFAIGARKYWISRENKKANGGWVDTRYAPPYICEVSSVRNGYVFFKWERKCKKQEPGSDSWEMNYGTKTDKLKVPVDEVVLNATTYTPGDYKQFFSDPRTRAEYLQWAHPLLSAEEWRHARTNKATKKSEAK